MMDDERRAWLPLAEALWAESAPDEGMISMGYTTHALHDAGWDDPWDLARSLAQCARESGTVLEDSPRPLN
jgi:predicted chitinase